MKNREKIDLKKEKKEKKNTSSGTYEAVTTDITFCVTEISKEEEKEFEAEKCSKKYNLHWLIEGLNNFFKKYSHIPHHDISVNDRLHIQW